MPPHGPVATAGRVPSTHLPGRLWLLAAGLALAVLTAIALSAAPARAADEAVPLSFAPNAGQADGHVRYLARGEGYAYSFADDRAVLSFASPAGDGETLEMRFAGASSDAKVEPGRTAGGTVNQVAGDTAGHASSLPAYQELVYRDLWPGIDMVFSGQSGELEYEFHVHPGADPGDIRLAYSGPGISLESDGSRAIESPRGVREDMAQMSHQQVLGGSGADSGRGIATDEHGNTYITGQTASFDYPATPGAFDSTYNNNTDAFVTKLDRSGAIVYSTFVGGSANDTASRIAVDGRGGAYITGFTGSPNYPTTPGAFDTTHNGGGDAFVTKLNPSGTALDYSTFLGGSGFSFEGGNGIAVDRDGSATVVGFTGSNAFPTTPGAYDRTQNGFNDVFVTKLNPSGSALDYSTFLGGTNTDTGLGVALDEKGGTYVTGLTASRDFPTTPGAVDATHNGGNDVFVARLDDSGSRLGYSTYLGGAASESGSAIAVDEKGRHAFVTGSTNSADYPTTRNAHDTSYNGGGDAFVTMLDQDGALGYSTFLGGTGSDAANGLAVDEKGKDAFVTGSTDSADYPTTRHAQDTSYNGGGDAFVTVLDHDGSRLGYSTFLGGAGSDVGNAIVTDDKGKLMSVTGAASDDAFVIWLRSHGGSGEG